jgi:GNAT superfamily N-acetyltransferase
MILGKLECKRKDGYLISSDKSLLSKDVINTAFGSKILSWCSPLPPEELQTLLENSYCLGVYEIKDDGVLVQVGFARIITDQVTLAYVTDVFIVPSHQNHGLGDWLISCAAELMQGKKYLRKVTLMAEIGRIEDYYVRKFGAKRVETVDEDGIVSLWLEGPAAYGKNVEDNSGVWSSL